MCGIFGSITQNKILIEKNIMPNRGPDDWGVEQKVLKDEYLTLFQSRLSIIGLGNQGHQPYKKYNNYLLVYNGEIYNYLYIKNKLITEFNVTFISNTDTEVLYEALINYGIKKTVNLLNGIFAFGFYDHINKRLIVIRDNVGVKPLYFYNDDNSFVFSSEIQSLFSLNILKPELKKELLGEYFANGWIYEPDTLFKSVYKLEAGNYLVYDIDRKKVTKSKYWDVCDEYTTIVEDDYILKAIDSQTIADVLYGIYFSGGVDSSIITHQLMKSKPYCLNLDLNDSESERVKLFGEKYNMKISKFNYNEEEFNEYDKLVKYIEEPIADPAIIPAFNLAKAARQANRIVMLSGIGGDEIDGGYTRHRVLFNRAYFKWISYLHYIPYLPSKYRRDIDRLRAYFKEPTLSNYFSLTAYFNKNEIGKLINNDSWHKKYSNKITSIINRSNLKSKIKKYIYLDMKGFLSSHNLIYMDKASMAASVEVRVPLLDKNIVNYYFNTIEYNPRNKSKPRLKRILKTQLEDSYIDIRKQGFRYPTNEWMLNYVNWAEIKDCLSNMLDIKMVDDYLVTLKTQPTLVSMKLFYIYTLYTWIKKFDVDIQ